MKSLDAILQDRWNRMTIEERAEHEERANRNLERRIDKMIEGDPALGFLNYHSDNVRAYEYQE